MITFKKNGRPTKAEKGILKNINNLLSNMDDGDKSGYDFVGERVTDSDRLNEIWGILTSDKKDAPKENIVTINNEKVDTSSGEIINEQSYSEKTSGKTSEESVNFVKEKNDMEELDVSDDMKNEETYEDVDGVIVDDANSGVDEVPSFFNPLKEPKKERSYNKAQNISVGEIEEPTFDAGASPMEEIEELEQQKEELRQEQEYQEEEERERPFDRVTNESMNDLSDKEKKLASKQLVQTVLEGYEMLHELGKRYVQYPEDKLQEKIIKQEIDPTMEIPIDERGNTTNPIDFFREFNEQAAESMSYDPEFGERVRPAMERVFAKKGWGMTDEQYLLVAFGKDISWKTVQLINLKKTANGIMDTFVQLQQEKNEAIRSQQAYSAPVQPDSIVTPPRREETPRANPIHQQPHEEEADGYSDAEMEDEYNGNEVFEITTTD